MLSASIERSRQKWQADGVFDRYWSKPTKKKGLGDTPNPAKETMSKLGICSMIIEPHVFEVTLYTVKDLPTLYPSSNVHPPPLSTPQYNPFAYNPQPAAQYPAYQSQHHTNPTQPTLPPFREGFGQFGPQGPPPIYNPPLPTTNPAVKPPPPGMSRSGSTGQNNLQGQDDEPKGDPVIQMLATRAASDPGLKTLMKVVASGKADQVQLREFQDHIDELNAILKSRPSPPIPVYDDSYHEPPPHGQQPGSRPADSQPSRPATAATYAPPPPAPAPVKVEPSSQNYPITAPPTTSKGHTVSKPDINAIVFDFGGTGDRFSFPRFSILEYLYSGTQVIVSFLVIRTGNIGAPGKYKGTKNYYQPITMRLTTPHPKVLEPLAKIVAPQDEVRRYMDSVFDKMSPAETVYLATRLPRTADAEELEKHDKTPQPDIQLIKAVYSPPNSLMPLPA